jgi:hypothetical protein
MDKEKAVINPPKFIKPSSATEFKSTGYGYHYDDIVTMFNSKYVASASPKLSNKLLPLLEELHEAGLEDKLEAHLNTKYGESKNPLLAPAYVYEAVETAMAPIKEVDKAKVISAPNKFRKPLSLSQLRKVLKSNPEYFKM